MRPDEIFIVLLLVVCAGVVAVLAVHSRKHQATSHTTDVSARDAASLPQALEEREAQPAPARDKRRR
jgi:hypothetical protein